MTNQSTASRESERETDRLRQQPCTTHPATVATAASTITSAVLGGSSSSSSRPLEPVDASTKRIPDTENSLSPPPPPSAPPTIANTPSTTPTTTTTTTRLQLSPTPIALYHRKSNRDYSVEPPEHLSSNNLLHQPTVSSHSVKNEHSRSPPEDYDDDDVMSNDITDQDQGNTIFFFFYFPIANKICIHHSARH